MVSGYAQDISGDKTGVALAEEVDARPETHADGVVGKDADIPPSLEAKKPKKGLFGGIFGSNKALLLKVSTAVQSFCLLSRCDSFTSFVVAHPSYRTVSHPTYTLCALCDPEASTTSCQSLLPRFRVGVETQNETKQKGSEVGVLTHACVLHVICGLPATSPLLVRRSTPATIPDADSYDIPQPEVPGDGTTPDVRGSPPVPSEDDGFQPASDLSVDMGDHVSDR